MRPEFGLGMKLILATQSQTVMLLDRYLSLTPYSDVNNRQ